MREKKLDPEVFAWLEKKSLARFVGGLKPKPPLSDEELKQIQEQFERDWPEVKCLRNGVN